MHFAPKGIDSSIGRASHRGCEVVGSISTHVLRFFYLGKRSWDLHTLSASVNEHYNCTYYCCDVHDWIVLLMMGNFKLD